MVAVVVVMVGVLVVDSMELGVFADTHTHTGRRKHSQRRRGGECW